MINDNGLMIEIAKSNKNKKIAWRNITTTFLTQSLIWIKIVFEGDTLGCGTFLERHGLQDL